MLNPPPAQMIVAVHDSVCTLGAYFVPYLWFQDDPKHPYMLKKGDKYFWGQRIYDYYRRMKCGRMAFTITGSPVLFFKSEEKEMIDVINYKTLVSFESVNFTSISQAILQLEFHRKRQMTGRIQAQATQSLPRITIDQGLGTTTSLAVSEPTSSSKFDAPPTEEQLLFNLHSNNFEYTSASTEFATTQQSCPQTTNVVYSYEDSQLQNNEASINANTFDFNYNIPSMMIQPEYSTNISQLFPQFGNFATDTFQFPNNNDGVSDTSSGFAFNMGNLPTTDQSYNLAPNSSPFDVPQFNYNNDISTSTFDPNTLSYFTSRFPINTEQLPSTEISQMFSESQSLGATTSSQSFPGVYNLTSNFEKDDTGASNISTYPLLNFNDHPIMEETPSNRILQSYSTDNLPSLDAFQFNYYNNRSASNIDADVFSNYLPINAEQLPSTENSQTFPKSQSLDHAPPSLGVLDSDNNIKYGADSSVIISAEDQVPSAYIGQTLSEFEVV